MLGASFNANGLGPYTVVVINDSNQDANFTLRVTNGFITDDSAQVTDPSAPTTAITTTAAATATTAAPAPVTAVTTTTATTTTVAAPAATTATTTTVAATATPAPAATTAVTTGGRVRAASLSGSLPVQNDQHFLGLEPEGRDTQITLRLTIEPQDSSELARRLNFWVLDSAGFRQFLGGTDASDVAIAAGNRVFRGLENERVASFRATGTGDYTVIVYNNATVPGGYELNIEGGFLIDDNSQTNESQSAGVGTTAAVTGTTTTTGTTAAPVSATTATTATTTTTAAARAGAPGGTYTVQSGDTMALIARDIYGDLQLYDELCAFNSITNCNVIEVGDVIQLPTTAQISAGATAATTAAATPRATATPAAAATPAATTAATTTVTNTQTTTPTTTTTTPTTAAPRPTVQPSTPVTNTGATGTTAAGSTILDTLAANGNFNTLVKALEATGLDSTLEGAGSLTLFAPTDAAFVSLRNEFNLTEEELLALPELAAVLRYHVLNAAVTSSEITDGLTEPTAEGNTVRFGVNGASTTVNGNANVIAADVEASNGVIHVIDKVIIPPPAQ